MALQSMQLDPNAAAYSDDEIVGKVNAATAAITRADAVEEVTLKESATFKKYTGTEQSKLTGIEEGADVNPADLAALDSTASTKLGGIEEGADANPTDDEVVTAINNASTAITREAALSQDDLKVVKTNPVSGEFLIKNIHRDADGKMDIEYDDVAV